MLNILHINSTSTGGAWVAFKTLENIFASTTQTQHKSINRAQLEHLKCSWWKLSLFNALQVMLDIFCYLTNEQKKTLPFSRYSIDDHPLVKEADVIHLHWVADTIGIDTISKLNKKIIWTCHDCHPLQGYNHLVVQNKSSGVLGKFIGRRISNYKSKKWKHLDLHFVLLSSNQKNSLNKAKILNAHKSSICPLPVTLPDTTEKIKHQLPESFVLVVSPNFKRKYKGFSFVKAIVQLSMEQNFKLVLVGKNSNQLCKYSSNCTAIPFVKNRSTLFYIYRQADLVVNTSQSETFGLVTIESILNGTPVIAFDQGINSEIINNGYNGFIVVSENDMTKKIKIIMESVNEFKLNTRFSSKYLENLNLYVSNHYNDLYHSLGAK